jgi:DNA modification methylase
MSDITWTPVRVRLGQIRPWDKNPRMSSRRQAERLIKSERDLGQIQTLAIGPADNDGLYPLYDGHQRCKAWFTVKGAEFELWAMQSNRPLREEERRQAAILVHTATGGWDWQSLSGWSAAEMNEWGMDADTLKGWKADVSALGEFLKSEQPTTDAEVQTDRAAEVLEKWGVKPGDLWQIGEHRLICGDCTDAAVVARVMGGEKAGAVVTDSPYGINREGIENDDPEGLRALFDGCLRVMPIENGVVINFQSPRLYPVWVDAIRQAGHEHQRALWFYDETDVTFPWRGWIMCSQIAIVSSIGKPEWSKDNYHHDCYIVKTAGKQDDSGGHTTAKPLDIVQDLVAHTTGDVYEPFSGSGTTLVACENLRRRCRAIEISPAYVAVALERMSTAFPALSIRKLE